MKAIFNDLKAGPLEIDMPDDLPPRPVNHPINYLLNPKEHNQTRIYLDNIYDMAQQLPKHQVVLELFGGMGIFPKLLAATLNPAKWTSVDIDESVRPLYQGPKEWATLEIANAFTYPVPEPTPGIVYMDIPVGTLQTLGRNMDGRRPMFERFTKAKVPHLMVTDMGYYWCHLANHWPWYLETFKTKPTKDNYHLLFNAYMEQHFGYTLVDERHGGGCQNFHFVPMPSHLASVS